MTHEHYLQAWQESQELAEAMQPLIGRLYRQQGIEITLYGRPLQNASRPRINSYWRLSEPSSWR